MTSHSINQSKLNIYNNKSDKKVIDEDINSLKVTMKSVFDELNQLLPIH
jgi:hypothetical protein